MTKDFKILKYIGNRVPFYLTTVRRPVREAAKQGQSQNHSIRTRHSSFVMAWRRVQFEVAEANPKNRTLERD